MRLRSPAAHDKDAIEALLPRFIDHPLPSWRPSEVVLTGYRDALIRRFDQLDAPGTLALVAENETGELLGFLHVRTETHAGVGVPSGHVSAVAVSEEAEGQGVAKTLLLAAEAWARDQGYTQLTLTVLGGNRHARDVYGHLGFEEDSIRMVKPLT
jgi:GNAT superfamily N-acetyltransferase